LHNLNIDPTIDGNKLRIPIEQLTRTGKIFTSSNIKAMLRKYVPSGDRWIDVSSITSQVRANWSAGATTTVPEATFVRDYVPFSDYPIFRLDNSFVPNALSETHRSDVYTSAYSGTTSGYQFTVSSPFTDYYLEIELPDTNDDGPNPNQPGWFNMFVTSL
jgi:hypothetical protein